MYIKIAYQASEGTGQALWSKERIGAERQSCEVGDRLRESCAWPICAVRGRLNDTRVLCVYS